MRTKSGKSGNRRRSALKNWIEWSHDMYRLYLYVYKIFPEISQDYSRSICIVYVMRITGSKISNMREKRGKTESEMK